MSCLWAALTVIQNLLPFFAAVAQITRWKTSKTIRPRSPERRTHEGSPAKAQLFCHPTQQPHVSVFLGPGSDGGPQPRSWARIDLPSYCLSGLLGRMGGPRVPSYFLSGVLDRMALRCSLHVSFFVGFWAGWVGRGHMEPNRSLACLPRATHPTKPNGSPASCRSTQEPRKEMKGPASLPRPTHATQDPKRRKHEREGSPMRAHCFLVAAQLLGSGPPIRPRSPESKKEGKLMEAQLFGRGPPIRFRSPERRRYEGTPMRAQLLAAAIPPRTQKERNMKGAQPEPQTVPVWGITRPYVKC